MLWVSSSGVVNASTVSILIDENMMSRKHKQFARQP